ncbi:hypothetical protein HYDPIDRAFT_34038 [Hydnomerulius pinastri MD-312]|uniref:Anoctamin transmembrane domain-containing protein n=1 Tax=Hydnomerulius pinastri MD-312 TaxID=994086 RepID=A0A0C9W7T8_9AGAM|nr:hypothetical protein HYDPIDRAFT_34038 [Hydnomerulius pinastri MD-312]
MALVSKLLEMYETLAKRFTNWENHAHQSSHASSLSTRVFTLSAMNAYLGLVPSAFVYVPFGGSVMHFMHYPMFFSGVHHAAAILERLNINWNKMVNFGLGCGRGENVVENVTAHSLFEADGANARRKLNPLRLQEQICGVFPGWERLQERKRERRKKKRVAFEDEPTGQGQVVRTKEEGEFLETVRSEVSLPEYEVFEDYGEMVTQFGYVALWSTIWPLAPVMALFNNYIEAWSDAFKIAARITVVLDVAFGTHEFGAGWNSSNEGAARLCTFYSASRVTRAPAVTHGGETHPRASDMSGQQGDEGGRAEQEIKERYLEQCSTGAAEGEAVKREPVVQDKDDWSSFWVVDEGLEEIQKTVKDV